MFEAFIMRALIGGVGVALIAGPLGAIIIWKRMALFGDALAHSALLGVGIAFYLTINPVLGILAFAVCFAVILSFMQNEHRFSNDTILGIVAHSCLAFGLVLIGLMDVPVNLESYLLGDILTIQTNDILLIYTSIVVIVALLYRYWDDVLMSCLHCDLALSSGVNVARIQLLFMLMVSVIVALSIKIVGILLISSLLILPAAAARRVTKTPFTMVLVASVMGMLSVVMGLSLSYYGDIITSAAVVVCAFVLFVMTSLINYLRPKQH